MTDDLFGILKNENALTAVIVCIVTLRVVEHHLHAQSLIGRQSLGVVLKSDPCRRFAGTDRLELGGKFSSCRQAALPGFRLLCTSRRHDSKGKNRRKILHDIPLHRYKPQQLGLRIHPAILMIVQEQKYSSCRDERHMKVADKACRRRFFQFDQRRRH